MTATFQINGTDFSSFISSGGIKWTRNDIDASKSGRDKSGTMRRKRIATKRKLSFTCRPLKHAEMKALNAALDAETVSITYLDPITDITTKTFYGSSVEGATLISQSGETVWTGASFNLIEV
jgi:hypothetical protein